nr:serine hydrolase domain-containing protein [uncultured Psychroserpens sp.]
MRKVFSVFGIILLIIQSITAQTQLLDKSNSLRTLAENFVIARNESDTTARLNKLSKIIGGSNSPKYATNQFLGDLLKHGGVFEPITYYSLSGGIAVHIIGKEAKTGDLMRYQLGIDPKNKNRIGLIAQTPSSKPPIIPEGQIDDQQVIDFIEAYVKQLSLDHGFSGSLLISRGDKILTEIYAGFANDATKEKIEAKTIMDMASGSKMFTAVLIGKAVENGLLNWDDTVVNLLPELSHLSWASEVTIAHLLTHASGIPEFWDSKFESHIKEVNFLSDFIPFFSNKPVLFKPNADIQYTNTNFIVLGLVLEQIYNKQYRDIVKQEILNLLKMDNTKLIRTNDVAESYLPAGPDWEKVNFIMPTSSAGGAFSNTTDLVRFANALLNNRFLSHNTLKKMTEEKVKLNGGSSYGYGFEIAIPDGRYFGHGGKAYGTNFEMRIYPDSETIVILFSNRDSYAFLDLLITLEQLLDQSH